MKTMISFPNVNQMIWIGIIKKNLSMWFSMKQYPMSVKNAQCHFKPSISVQQRSSLMRSLDPTNNREVLQTRNTEIKKNHIKRLPRSSHGQLIYFTLYFPKCSNYISFTLFLTILFRLNYSLSKKTTTTFTLL